MNTLPPLQLLPAVDVVNGQAVRLLQGEAGSETAYGDPAEAAATWADHGATWIHLVDLDAAFGRGSNHELLARIVRDVPVRIELTGGIRDDASLQRALDAGAARVNIGTAALENPEWTAKVIERFGDRVAVGLDVRGEVLAGRGWTSEGGNLWEVLRQLEAAGCSRYVVTDVTKDGTLTGPNTQLLERVAREANAPVVASGGISSLDDLAALRELVPAGVDSAIVGKALYEGAFTLAQAIEISGEQR
ncbi:bifunctional 1-(5-phosphoribosyl)-5-((5-phosphoribosylamino)methylideneamino)imidazole-4-carboxamide isomerase/phosphoribosylanthranilate isomerase PriA [Ancrocorticia sp.]|uniref:bifunctional 1-(5-phosphoribosyl)-5-((5- phosphoribosylamino)methylideneamino)imidazole-4- carboxamide isomerase/phosphoribosylanthranilate isomerase PriA n=1 Tax=Ancrocorticia sp. TaxID=2593684 RepID=UPI003F91D431